MATYKEIFGKQIKFLATDPSVEGIGQIWYNSVSNTFKTFYNPAAWSAGGNLNTARDSLMTACRGTIAANLCFGGHDPLLTTATESYNGTTWTTVNALPVATQLGGGAGTQGAALCYGGSIVPGIVGTTESWDGTNWTAGNAMNTARNFTGSTGAGTQTAALAQGGGSPAPSQTVTEEFNGTSWTTTPATMNTARSNKAGTGTQTAALAIGGAPPPGSPFAMTTTEAYNGTSWTSKNNMNTARRRAGGAGTSAAGLAIGGLVSGPAVTTSTEIFDGTDWTAGSALGTGRYYLGGSGAVNNDAMAIGGLTTGSATSFTNATEEYTNAQAVKTITTS